MLGSPSTPVPIWLLLVASIALALPLSAQRTWVVDDTMSAGADYPDLPSAYVAAADNDRIVVRRGTGQGYQLPNGLTRPMLILGELGTPKVVLLYPQMGISCLANEVIVISNFEVRAVGGDIFTSIANSPGLVVLSQLDYLTVRQIPVTPYRAHRVVMVDCRVTAWDVAVRCFESNLWLLNCQTQGLAGGRDSAGAVEVKDRSFLRMVGGTHVGGDGLGQCLPLQPGAFGRSAIYQAGPIVIAGRAQLRGGLWQRYNPSCGSGSNTLRQSAISLNCLPWSVIDPMVQALAPFPSPPCATDLIREMPAVIPSPAQRGAAQTIRAHGPSASVVSVFVSFLSRFDPIALPIGDVWLDPSLTLHVGSGGVNGSRELTLQTVIPNWLSLGDVLVYQAVSLSSNSFELSQPGIAVVH